MNKAEDLKPHEQRVVDEHDELCDKIDKLGDFLATNPIYSQLPEEEKQLLADQYFVMERYVDILWARIQLIWKSYEQS